jgi:AcrR family transcriptional regulator
MGAFLRKQRELQQREQFLLSVARTMLVQEGYHRLSLDRLATRSEYSKGTIYDHFPSKEDLVAALAVQSALARIDLMNKALQFEGSTRERMLAVQVSDEVFGCLHPHHFHSELVIRMAGLDNRVSEPRREQLAQSEAWCIDRLVGLVSEAFKAGEIPASGGHTPESVVLGLVSLVIGLYVGALNFPAIKSKLILAEPCSYMRRNFDVYLDGLGWSPLSGEWDYETTLHRIKRELFAEEFRQIDAT